MFAPTMCIATECVITCSRNILGRNRGVTGRGMSRSG